MQLIAATATAKGLKVRAQTGPDTCPAGIEIRHAEMAAPAILRHGFDGEERHATAATNVIGAAVCADCLNSTMSVLFGPEPPFVPARNRIPTRNHDPACKRAAFTRSAGVQLPNLHDSKRQPGQRKQEHEKDPEDDAFLP